MLNPQKGFTLLEVLLAVGITAMIGVGATQLLTGTMDTKQATENRSNTLSILQRADNWIKRDILQVAPRKILDEFSIKQPVAHNQGEYLLELTHSGRAMHDFIDKPTSNLQRVAYAVKSHDHEFCERAIKKPSQNEQDNAQNCLVRIFWHALDRTSDNIPRTQILIDNIKRAEIRFKGQTINLQDPSLSIRSDEWQSEWPSPYADQNSINDLAMIKLILDIPSIGEVERIYEVPRYAFASE
ncbi:general secretion pathway protein J [Oceanobacter sp. RED65]|uniref:Type II secretion system protein J n=2 Tax=Bermanella marisrubri TaxID=207949 RepID=Q1N4H4_9GAMM|nr:general secretion pathway protein J [Oceanobacter sp. RED65] [Bermanella marisrubri]